MIAAASDASDEAMTALQIRVVGLCVIINMLDGFDILAMAFAAPNIAKDWQLRPALLGSLFSVGLAGMVIGSICMGLLADRFGRRPMILICLVLAEVGMTLAANAHSVPELAAARVLTGIAVGGIGPCLNSLVAEYASTSTRTLCVALMQAGFALGSALGGLAAISILNVWSWRSIFGLGAVLTLFLIPLAWKRLPESVAYLQLRSAKGKADRGDAGLQNEPDTIDDQARARWWLELWSHSASLSAGFGIFFLCIMSFYFINSWTPKLLADSGLPVSLGLLGGVALAAGGVPAAFLVGALARHHGLPRVVALSALGTGILTAAFGLSQGPVEQVLALALVLGVLINMTQVGIYAIFAGLFPPLIRTGATGIAVGLGRLGSVAGPWIAGLMLENAWKAPAMFATMAIPYAFASGLIWLTRRQQRY